MEARNYAVYKHIIVAIGEEITVRPTDFATAENLLDDPCACEHACDFNKITLLHFTISR